MEARARLGQQEAKNDEVVVDLCLWVSHKCI